MMQLGSSVWMGTNAASPAALRRLDAVCLAKAGESLGAAADAVRRAYGARSEALRAWSSRLSQQAAALRAERAALSARADELAQREQAVLLHEADCADREQTAIQRDAQAAATPATPAESFARLLNAWLEQGNDGREIALGELHRALTAVAASLGLDAACLGHARSLGLRLRNYTNDLKGQFSMHRTSDSRRRALISFRRVT